MENVGCKPYPWLVFVGGEKLEDQIFCDVISNSKTPILTRSICGSTNNRSVLMQTNIGGWLLLKLDVTESESSSSWCLWNAFTLQSINLPHAEVLESKTYCIDYVLLTKSPEDRDCAILLWLKDTTGILYSFINGDDGWTFKNYQEELIKFRGDRDTNDDRFWNFVVYDEDNIFMISRSRVLAKLEITESKTLIIRPYVSFLRWPMCFVAGPWYKNNVYWVACRGDLFQITIIFGGLEYNQIMGILVFKLDFSDMSWKRVDNCPNTSFFCKGQQCLACPVTSVDSNKVGNQIYIIDDVREGRLSLYTYHIERKTIKTSLISCTPNNESEPYWMPVPDDQALTKTTEKDYHNGEGDEKVQLFLGNENGEVVTVPSNYDDEKMKLDNLHVDILRSIALHLNSPLDLLNFRATSRSFLEIGSVKEWRNQKSFDSDNSITPWLVFPNSHQDGKYIFSMMDPISRSKYYVTTLDTLEENSIICCSTNGWLLMSSPFLVDGIVKDSNLRFYNPLTKSVVYLPGVQCNPAHHFFNFAPDNLNCMVVGMSVDHCLEFFIASRSKPSKDEFGQWRWEEADITREYEADKFFVRQSNVNIVIVGGIFYFLVGDGDIAYLSEHDYHLRIHNLEEPCRKSSYEQCFLTECDGDLLSIYVGKEWKWLRAFKFNEPDMVWNEVKGLENYNLYLSNVSSIALEVQPPQVGNRIYFSRYFQESIVYFSFITQKFHLSDENDSVIIDYYGSEEQMYGCWFEPCWK